MITEVTQLAKHCSSGADTLNCIVPCEALTDLDANPTRFQLEGFVLHPRRLECEPFEVSTDDMAEMLYLFRLIRESYVALGAVGAEALTTAMLGHVPDAPLPGGRT